MKFFALGLLLLCLVVSVHCQESEDTNPDNEDETWWSRFKQRVKNVLSRWRDDIKLLWDDVLSKTDDMKSWTSDMFTSLKRKMKEWLESRPDVPDDEKNEIETFISKLKVPTEKPEHRKSNDDPTETVNKVSKNIDP